MPKKVCSFCGRDESQVKLLITGMNGYICEECARQAWEIVQTSGVLGNDKYAKEPFKVKQVQLR